MPSEWLKNRENLRPLRPLFSAEPPNMFHIVSLNGVDSGNAVTLLYLPSFQLEVWLAGMVVAQTGTDWVVGTGKKNGSKARLTFFSMGFLLPPFGS